MKRKLDAFDCKRCENRTLQKSVLLGSTWFWECLVCHRMTEDWTILEATEGRR